MVETLGEDYIRTATAKGVRTNRILFKHALRAAIVPVITIFGIDFATLLWEAPSSPSRSSASTASALGPAGPVRTPIDLNVVSARCWSRPC